MQQISALSSESGRGSTKFVGCERCNVSATVGTFSSTNVGRSHVSDIMTLVVVYLVDVLLPLQRS